MNCAFITEHPHIATALAVFCLAGTMFVGSIAVSLFLSFRRGK